MDEAFGVSILINSFNYGRYLCATIESALAQTHKRLQVVVVDDGSTDTSRQIIKRFGNRIESLLQENQGQVAACRHALALARHDIVIFLDADDLLDPEAASEVAAVWYEGVVKVQYSLKVIDERGDFKGNVFPKYSATMTPATVRATLYQSGSYPDSPTSGNAYDRAFLETVMPLLKIRHAPDGELNGLAPLYGDVVTIPEPLGSYRIHGHNSFAQGHLVVDRFKEYLRQSESRVAFLRDHYRSKGRIIEHDVLNRDLKYLEYRLVVLRLDSAERRSTADWGKTLGHALRAAWRSPHDVFHRALRLSWIVMVAVSPAPIARGLVKQRFVPGQRWPWITRLTTIWRSKGQRTWLQGNR